MHVEIVPAEWYTVVTAFFFFVVVFFCQRKRNGNETKTLLKRVFSFFSKRFNVQPMQWQKWFLIKRVFLSENVFRNVLTFSQ